MAEFVQAATGPLFVLSDTISVTVPSFAQDKTDFVDVDVSAASDFQPHVGDTVLPIPMVALPTDCLCTGAYVTATDHVTVTFASKEGGSGVTGAAKNFRFAYVDGTPTA